MTTPEQGFVSLIKDLRAKGIRYRQLMQERDKAESESDDEDDDSISTRSTQSIDHDIDDLLNDTMTVVRKLKCDNDTDDDGDCHKCHHTGCPLLADESRKMTVFGFYTDTGLKYESQCEADSLDAAIQRVKNLYPDESITIVAVIRGHHHTLMEGEYIEDTDDLKFTGGGT